MRFNFSLVFITLIFCKSFAQENEPRVYSSYYGFDPLSIGYLYGDNVKLRAEPNGQAEVISMLRIGTELEILEKTENSLRYNGMESFWYKVKVNNQIGYVLQGLISLEKLSFGQTNYFFAVKQTDLGMQLKIRCLVNDTSFVENTYPLNTDAFQLKISDNRGLEAIQHILTIDLFAEACGIDGGGYYLFYDETGLHTALKFSSVGDGGVYWFDEYLVFPNDNEYGRANKVVYTRVLGEMDDEDGTDWSEEKITTRLFEWKEGAFYPDIIEFQKMLDEREMEGAEE